MSSVKICLEQPFQNLDPKLRSNEIIDIIIIMLFSRIIVPPIQQASSLGFRAALHSGEHHRHGSIATRIQSHASLKVDGRMHGCSESRMGQRRKTATANRRREAEHRFKRSAVARRCQRHHADL